MIADQRKKTPRFKGLFHAASTIVREEVRVISHHYLIYLPCLKGVGGLYKGLGPTVTKQGSNQAIRFFVMESLRNIYTGGDLGKQVPYYVVAMFGAFAGQSWTFHFTHSSLTLF